MGETDQSEPIEKAGVDELRALQLRRLRGSLQHAYEKVPHYRKAFDAAGIHPGDLKDLADLAKFPFTTKADLRVNYPFGMFAVPMDDIVRIHASSGTTGKPTVVGYTRQDIDTCGPQAANPATSSTSPTATACSPVGWARTTAPRRWAPP
jgi:phenylacetate-CoA ligase